MWSATGHGWLPDKTRALGPEKTKVEHMPCTTKARVRPGGLVPWWPQKQPGSSNTTMLAVSFLVYYLRVQRSWALIPRDSPQGALKTYSVFPRVQTKIPQLSAKRKSQQTFFCFLKKINISRRRLCKGPGGEGGQEVAPTLSMNFLTPSRQFMVGIWRRRLVPTYDIPRSSILGLCGCPLDKAVFPLLTVTPSWLQ